MSELSELPELPEVDAYLDAVPRTGARAVPVGPFVLFIGNGPWSYYARPQLGLAGSITVADVRMLEARCRSEQLPLSIEWIQERTPSLAGAARAAGLTVSFRPLLALDLGPGAALVTGDAAGAHLGPGDAPAHAYFASRILRPGEPDAASARAVAELGFGNPGTGVGVVGPVERDQLAGAMEASLLAHLRKRSAAGHSVTAVAEDESGIVSVGLHQPVGVSTEIVGVATLPAARRRGGAAVVTRTLVEHARSIGVQTVMLSADSDDVARIYRRVGFHRIGTSCEAGPPEPV